MTNTRHPISRQLQELHNHSSIPNEKMVMSFWENVEALGGTPIIEDDPTNEENKTVTLLWKGDNAESKENVYVVWDYKRYWDIPITEAEHLKQIPGTNIYSLTVSLPKDLLTVYSFYKKPDNVDIEELTHKVDQTRLGAGAAWDRQNISSLLQDEINRTGFQKDPLNLNVYSCNPDRMEGSRQSILAMPSAPQNRYAPSSSEEAQVQNTELRAQGRLREAKADLSNTPLVRSVGEITVRLHDNTNTSPWPEVMAWQNNKSSDSNDVLLYKISDKEWGIFGPKFGAPVSDALLESLLSINSQEEASDPDVNKKIKEGVNEFFNNRNYSIYLPKDYDPSNQPPNPLLIVLDGQQYIDVGAPWAIHSMVDDKVFGERSPVTIFLPAVGTLRVTEYACNDTFTEFLRSFVDDVKKQYNLGDSIVLGASSGGQAAFYAGLKGVFDYVISQSGKLCGKQNECALVYLPSPPNLNDLEKLQLPANAAYVRSGDQLFYINKEKKECIELKLDDTKSFDRAMHLTATAKPPLLIDPKLEEITSLTGHVHQAWGEELKKAFDEFIKSEGSTKFVMNVGTLETRVIDDRPTSLLQLNRDMYDSMKRHGLSSQCVYQEYNGDHLFISWIASLPTMLTLMPSIEEKKSKPSEAAKELTSSTAAMVAKKLDIKPSSPSSQRQQIGIEEKKDKEKIDPPKREAAIEQKPSSAPTPCSTKLTPPGTKG